ncbi:MAG: hypothetical protein JWR88_1219 [Pseudonocardia sp.]|nr:hypothetical protein [Pseudonocardia sp.]
MSTDIDGPAPSMADDSSDSEIDPQPATDAAAELPSDVATDGSSVKLRRELRKRAAQRIRTAGGRHVRTDVDSKALPDDYVPRHALSTPGPAASASESGVGAASEEDFYPPPADPEVPVRKRERVVLAERRRPVRPVRTEVDVRELTGVGDMLSTNLIRSQLGLALRVGSIALFTLALLPALFAVFPVLGRLEVLNIRLAWLLLGGLVYPFLLALGWLHARASEKLEQSFTEHVRD